MKVKKLMAAALVGSMALSLAACGGDTTTTEENTSGETTAESTEAGDGSYNISVILKTTAAEYWKFVQSGAEAYAEEHRIRSRSMSKVLRLRLPSRSSPT